MRTIVLAAMLLGATPAFADKASDEAAIRGLEETWNYAHLSGNKEALSALWADDLVIAVPKMAPMDKATALRFWDQVPVKFTLYTSELSAVRVYHDTAIADGTVHRSRKFGDRPEMRDA